jgi:hypothetical protein
MRLQFSDANQLVGYFEDLNLFGDNKQAIKEEKKILDLCKEFI